MTTRCPTCGEDRVMVTEVWHLPDREAIRAEGVAEERARLLPVVQELRVQLERLRTIAPLLTEPGALERYITRVCTRALVYVDAIARQDDIGEKQ